MKTLVSIRLLAMYSAALIGACADAEAPSGPSVRVEVAPLQLPGAVGVDYAIAVFNADPGDHTQIFDVQGAVLSGNDGILVWTQPSITSNRFGNNGGGAISYVGPCDGSADENWVALALAKIDVGDGKGSYAVATGTFSGGTKNLLDDQNSALTATPGSNDGDPDFVNPAPYDDALVMKFRCEENKDTKVVFNLTIMRDADQGFFDVAVNFEDIFCSAKFDTCSEAGVPIELLFGDDSDTDTANVGGDALGDEPGRDRTGVFALACTASPGDNIVTDLLFSEVRVTCPGDVSFSLPLSGLSPAAGNQHVTVDLDADSVAETVEYALYFGSEDLPCGTSIPCNKTYLSLAIDLEDLPLGCTLALDASAQDGNANPATFVGGALATFADTGTSYPFIRVRGADLSHDACVTDGLDDGRSVTTFYGSSFIGGTTPELMCQHSLGGAAPVGAPAQASTLVAGTELVATLEASASSPSLVSGVLGFDVTLQNNGSAAVQLGLLWSGGYRYHDAAVYAPEAPECGLFAGLTVSDNSPLAPGESRTVRITAGPWFGGLDALPATMQLLFWGGAASPLVAELDLGGEDEIEGLTISGVIFSDANDNGIFDAGDAAIPGASLTFVPDTAPGANLLVVAPPWSGLTDAQGQVVVVGVPAGVPLCKSLQAPGHHGTTQCGVVLQAPAPNDSVITPVASALAMRATCVAIAANDVTCDAIDDDCDGVLDEDANLLTCDPCLVNSDCCSDQCTGGVCTGAALAYVLPALTVAGPGDLPSDYECITAITGELDLSPDPNNGSMPLMNFASLASIGSAIFSTSTSWEVAHFPLLTNINGPTQIFGSGADSFLSVPALAAIAGQLDIIGHDLELDFSALSALGDLFVFDIFASTGANLDLDFPALTTTTGNLSIYSAAVGSSVSFPALTTAGSVVVDPDATQPSALSFPVLATLSGGLQVALGNPSPPYASSWTNLAPFASVQSVGNLYIRNNQNLTSLGLTSLTAVTGSFDVRWNPSLDNCAVLAFRNGLSTLPAPGASLGQFNDVSVCPNWAL